MLLPAENIELRARLRAIPKLIKTFPGQSKYLQNGTIPPECEKSYIQALSEETAELLKDARENIKPLGFVETCTFGTWFEAFPEKVAGVERLMTSLAFPVSIRGNEDDVRLTIGQALSKHGRNRKIGARQQEAKAGSPLVRIELSVHLARVRDALSGRPLKASRRHDKEAFTRLFEDYPNFIERYRTKYQLTPSEREQVFPSERFKSRMAIRQLVREQMKRLDKI